MVQVLVSSSFESAKIQPYAISKVRAPRKAPITKSSKFAMLKRKLGTTARTTRPKTEKITQPITKPTSGSNMGGNITSRQNQRQDIPSQILIKAVTGESELCDMRYRRSTTSEGGTRDGLETAGRVC